MLVRKTRNISANRWGTACKFLKFRFYDRACSETGGPSVRAIKIRKKLDLQQESCKIIVWWRAWGVWITEQNFTNTPKVREKRKVININLQATSWFTGTASTITGKHINPIIEQSSFNDKVVWLLAPIGSTEKLLQTHTPLTWKQSPNFQLLLWFISTWFLNLKKSFPILLFNPNRFIESSHMTPLPFGYTKVMLI